MRCESESEREEGGIDKTRGGGRDSAAGTEAAEMGEKSSLHTYGARARPIGMGGEGEGGGAAALSKSGIDEHTSLHRHCASKHFTTVGNCSRRNVDRIQHYPLHPDKQTKSVGGLE